MHACMLHACRMHEACSLHAVCYMHAACMQHVACMYAYILHVALTSPTLGQIWNEAMVVWQNMCFDR